jgi:hypothetical protein
MEVDRQQSSEKNQKLKNHEQEEDTLKYGMKAFDKNKMRHHQKILKNI